MELGEKLKHEEGTAYYDSEAIYRLTGGGRGNLVHAFRELWDVCDHSRGMVKDYAVFKKYVPLLLQNYCFISELNKDYAKIQSELDGKASRKNNKRWTKEEDEMLIEYVCADEEYSQIEVATAFGRTPAAIKTRISHLVGIGRLSQQVAGRFIGTIDGEVVEGKIQGTVLKER